jgi:phenylacetate-CoA ligase
MSILERFYQRKPANIQSVLLSAEGMRIQRRRYGSPFQAILRSYLEREFLSEAEISSFRDTQIVKAAVFANKHSTFWRERFREAGIVPAEMRGLRDLCSLPIIDKSVVRENIKIIAPNSWIFGRPAVAHTSGTTGSSLVFPVTSDTEKHQWSVWWRFRQSHGIHQTEWCSYFGGRSIMKAGRISPPFWRWNYPGRQLQFSAYHLSEETAPIYLGQLLRTRHAWLHGYPSQIALLAAYSISRGFDFSHIRWVTLGAESLLPSQARQIEDAFGVKPIQHYGQSEGVANISECKFGRMHVDEDFSGVEFVTDSSGSSRIVGTNIINPYFPLFRYSMGDLAEPVSVNCPCRRPGRVVSSIDGRIEDYIVTKDGRKVGRLDHVFKDSINVVEAQLRQTETGSITALIVPAERFSEVDKETVLQELRTRLGADMSINIVLVQSIPRSPSGKFRFVISTVGRQGGIGALRSNDSAFSTVSLALNHFASKNGSPSNEVEPNQM